jgi:antitoxin component of MazEF toxin-antitoxin module
MKKRRMKKEKNQISKIKTAGFGKGRPKFRLKDLLREITPENRQSEVDWGAPVGKEEW